MRLLDVEVDLTFAPFNQLFQELLAPASGVSTNTSGVNVLMLRLEDLADEPARAQKLLPNCVELTTTVLVREPTPSLAPLNSR
jgi:hypothetical protein